MIDTCNSVTFFLTKNFYMNIFSICYVIPLIKTASEIQFNRWAFSELCLKGSLFFIQSLFLCGPSANGSVLKPPVSSSLFYVPWVMP